jgi:hypothetical protein
MTKGVRDSLNRYTVTSDLRFNDLTIRRFNVAKSFDIRISSFVGSSGPNARHAVPS